MAEIQGFRGRIVQPSDPDYDQVRALYNGMIDKRPRLIARCADVADVVAAVNHARQHRLLLAIRGGGHNGPGLGSCDDGLVVDLSGLKGIRVDPAARTVRVEPGCTSADVDHATHAFGLAVPLGIIGSTGVAGLTLGGGTGYLTRKHGLTVDNLLEADVVLASGELMTTSAESHADLFWALRGGGGNFGVVTSFLFRAHPATTVFGGPVFFDARDAPVVMSRYRDTIAAAPEELGMFVGLKTVPPVEPFPREHWGKRACALIGAYDGGADDAKQALAPVLGGLPEPLFNWMGDMPFPAINALFDPFYPKGLQWYWKGDFVKSLPDEAIAVHVAQAGAAPTDFCMTHLYPIDGAVHRVPADATAWSVRDARWSMVIAGISPDPADADALKRWGRGYWSAIHPFNMEGGYVNFMFDDEADSRVQASYGPNYARLADIKARYDGDNLFRVNQNIKPLEMGRK